MTPRSADIDQQLVSIIESSSSPLPTVDAVNALKEAGYRDAEASGAVLRLVNQRRLNLTDDRRLTLYGYPQDPSCANGPIPSRSGDRQMGS